MGRRCMRRILQNRQKEFANLALAPFQRPTSPPSASTPEGCIMTGCIMQDGYADELSVRHTQQWQTDAILKRIFRTGYPRHGPRIFSMTEVERTGCRFCRRFSVRRAISAIPSLPDRCGRMEHFAELESRIVETGQKIREKNVYSKRYIRNDMILREREIYILFREEILFLGYKNYA